MTDQQALETIDLLCGDDFCEDMSMRMRDLEPDSDLKTAVDKLSRIYRIAHSLVQSHSCFHVHDDWRHEAEQAHAALHQEHSWMDQDALRRLLKP